MPGLPHWADGDSKFICSVGKLVNFQSGKERITKNKRKSEHDF